jgi:hypothetical protein
VGCCYGDVVVYDLRTATRWRVFEGYEEGVDEQEMLGGGGGAGEGGGGLGVSASLNEEVDLEGQGEVGSYY